MHRLVAPFAAVLAGLFAFTATAHAASAVEPAGGSLWDLLRPVFDAFAHGQYLYAGSLALVLAVALARRYGGDRVPWLHTDLGSATLVFAGSLGATLSATLATGAGPDVAMVGRAAWIAFGAAGGYATLKALVVKPYLAKLATVGPTWLHKPADLLLWVFQEKAPGRPAGNTAASPGAQ